MPSWAKPPKSPSVAELAAEKSAKDTNLAKDFDKDPETPGTEPENLVVVETKFVPRAPYSHPLLRLTREFLEKMNRVEILAIGWDRGYWKKGVSTKLKPELVELFLSAQESHDGLHDAPQDS